MIVILKLVPFSVDCFAECMLHGQGVMLPLMAVFTVLDDI